MLNASVTQNSKNFTPSECFAFAESLSCEVKVKLNREVCYSPRDFQQVETATLGGKFGSPTHWPSLLPGVTPGTNFY